MGRVSLGSSNFSQEIPLLLYQENVKVKLLSRVWLFATSGTVDCQAPPSMGFSSQEYWSGLPFPSLGHLSNPVIDPWSPTLQADSLLSESLWKPFQENTCLYCMLIPPMSLLLLQRFDEHFLHRNLLLWIVRSEKLIFWLVSCHPYFWKQLCLSVIIQQETEVHQEDYKKYQN